MCISADGQQSHDDDEDDASVGGGGDGGSMPSRFRRMTEGLCEVLDDFGLISFVAMNIADGEVSVQCACLNTVD